MDLKESELLGDGAARHWYYRAKLAALIEATRHLAPGPVLDVGAGTGFFARALLQAGRATEATCIDPGYPADRDEAVDGLPLRFRRHADAWATGGATGLVLMMDVLEHVPDDVALAREYVGQAASGTHFIVTVPAFQWLWSGHDEFLGHYRRYTLARLERALVEAGLRIEVGCYFYGALLPLIATQRLVRRLAGGRRGAPKSDMRPFGPVANALLWSVCRAEVPLFRRNRVAGLSVFAHAVKP